MLCRWQILGSKVVWWDTCANTLNAQGGKSVLEKINAIFFSTDYTFLQVTGTVRWGRLLLLPKSTPEILAKGELGKDKGQGAQGVFSANHKEGSIEQIETCTPKLWLDYIPNFKQSKLFSYMSRGTYAWWTRNGFFILEVILIFFVCFRKQCPWNSTSSIKKNKTRCWCNSSQCTLIRYTDKWEAEEEMNDT